jgi:hypothetical protein
LIDEIRRRRSDPKDRADAGPFLERLCGRRGDEDQTRDDGNYPTHDLSRKLSFFVASEAPSLRRWETMNELDAGPKVPTAAPQTYSANLPRACRIWSY